MKEKKEINVIETLENCKAFIKGQKQIFEQKEVVDSIDNHIEALDRAIAMIKSYDEFLEQLDNSTK